MWKIPRELQRILKDTQRLPETAVVVAVALVVAVGVAVVVAVALVVAVVVVVQAPTAAAICWCDGGHGDGGRGDDVPNEKVMTGCDVTY